MDSAYSQQPTKRDGAMVSWGIFSWTKSKGRQVMISKIRADLDELLAAEGRSRSRANILWAIFGWDAFLILATFRVRQAAHSMHIPLVGRIIRGLQMILWGIELGRDIQLGAGVYFVHSVGTVVGGTSKVGKGTRLYGCNTIGTVSDNGCPVIGDRVSIGAGARVLGPVTVGAQAKIGANAVVMTDVPSEQTAVGIPAKIVSKS